jgi:hypothetical protein
MTFPFRLLCFGFLVLGLSCTAHAGSVSWTGGSLTPCLTLSLGDSLLKKTADLAPGTEYLTLTLKKFLLDEPTVQLVWKSDGDLWMKVTKKIPGEETTEQVALPPGRQISLEITTLGGTRVASIKLLRK